jgi:hypothetical protein
MGSWGKGNILKSNKSGENIKKENKMYIALKPQMQSKMKNNLIAIVLCLVIFQIRLFSQDTVKSLYISTYFTKPMFNEVALVIEYKTFNRDVFGLTVGEVYSNEHFQVNKLSSSQDKNPGLVYDGIATRILYSYYLISKKQHAFYVSPQFMFKALKYDNHEFEDSWGDKGYNTYVRNEKAQLYGLDFLVGWAYFIGEENSNFKIYLNMYVGFGGRYKQRDIETISSTINGSPEYVVPVGNTTQYQKYIIPIVGLKFGVGFDFYDKTTHE